MIHCDFHSMTTDPINNSFLWAFVGASKVLAGMNPNGELQRKAAEGKLQFQPNMKKKMARRAAAEQREIKKN